MTSPDADYVTKTSPRGVADTHRRFLEILAAKGLEVFATIDQRAAAQGVGLQLRETLLIIFGNPAAGTPVMAAAPLSGLDLPLKVQIWDDAGRTRISYLATAALAARHGLEVALVAPLCGIDALTDAAIAG
jgi:uncharacterized protein (DUF302 family)